MTKNCAHTHTQSKGKKKKNCPTWTLAGLTWNLSPGWAPASGLSS